MSGILFLPLLESCTGQDLADLGDRLRDWFQLLHGNAKRNNSGKFGAGATSGQKKKVFVCLKEINKISMQIIAFALQKKKVCFVASSAGQEPGC